MAVQYALTQLTWPGTGVSGTATVTITGPDANVQVLQATTASQQNPGFFTVWFTPQLIGTYGLAWASTGGQTYTTTVVVTPAPTSTLLLTLADCLNTLKLPTNLAGSDPVRDADMLAYAAAAQAVAEGIVGPITPTTITQVFDGGPAALLLRAKPTSILSVTVNGAPAGNWVPDFGAAMITAVGAGFPPGVKNVNVQYTAGSGQVRPNVSLGVREIFRQMWERSRALGGQASPDVVFQGYAVPNAVYEMLAPDATLPGIA